MTNDLHVPVLTLERIFLNICFYRSWSRIGWMRLDPDTNRPHLQPDPFSGIWVKPQGTCNHQCIIKICMQKQVEMWQLFQQIQSIVTKFTINFDSWIHEQYISYQTFLVSKVVLNQSDHHSVLALTSLVVGRYIFDLTVVDEEGQSSTDTATVVVKPCKYGHGYCRGQTL